MGRAHTNSTPRPTVTPCHDRQYFINTIDLEGRRVAPPRSRRYIRHLRLPTSNIEAHPCPSASRRPRYTPIEPTGRALLKTRRSVKSTGRAQVPRRRSSTDLRRSPPTRPPPHSTARSPLRTYRSSIARVARAGSSRRPTPRPDETKSVATATMASSTTRVSRRPAPSTARTVRSRELMRSSTRHAATRHAAGSTHAAATRFAHHPPRPSLHVALPAGSSVSADGPQFFRCESPSHART